MCVRRQYEREAAGGSVSAAVSLCFTKQSKNNSHMCFIQQHQHTDAVTHTHDDPVVTTTAVNSTENHCFFQKVQRKTQT